MEEPRLSSFPHHSWLSFHVRHAGPRPLSVRAHGVVHSVSLTVAGCHAIRWIGGGRETQWTEDAGTVHFIPADGEQRTFLTTAAPRFESAVLILPATHLGECLETEGLRSTVELHRILAPDDRVLRDCMQRLTDDTRDAVGAGEAAGQEDSRKDAAARRLVLRLAELGGGGVPDWNDDSSVFARRTLDHLIEHIDAHLHITPSLTDMALLVGLSPSHFARKFRTSTGLSLHRFVNLRRVQAALDALAGRDVSLAAVALELGFSSQSHLTRLFHERTGMTPARYRRHCACAVG